MNDLAKAYGDLVLVKEYSLILSKLEETNDDTRECFKLMFRLDALNRIKLDLGTLLESGYLNPQIHPHIVKS